MANSLLLWTSSMEKEGEGKERENQGLEEQEMRAGSADSAKTRRRKSGKLLQKKQPQRGLGVAQLERMRLQERWKKITETNQVSFQAAQNHHYQYQLQFPFLEQQNVVSAPFGRFPPVNYGTVRDFHPSSQPFLLHPYKVGNGAFADGASGSSGLRAVFSDQFEADRVKISTQEAMFSCGNPFGTAKELPSTQKINCLSDQYCDICVTKKRMKGENLGFDGVRAQYRDRIPMNGSDVLDLNLGRNQTNDEVRHAGYSGLTVHEEEERVEDEGREYMGMGRIGLKEFEFLPCEGNSSSVAYGRAVGERSPSKTNFLDLSLKLSC